MIFFTTLGGIAMRGGRVDCVSGVRGIDLSADFRLHSISEGEQWYGVLHTSPSLVDDYVMVYPKLIG